MRPRLVAIIAGGTDGGEVVVVVVGGGVPAFVVDEEGGIAGLVIPRLRISLYMTSISWSTGLF